MMKPILRMSHQYRDRAAACERLAQDAVSLEARETMLYLATRWRALGDEADAKPRTRPINSELHRCPFPRNRGNFMKTAAEFRAEAEHMRTLARGISDSPRLTAIEELTDELERLADEAENGEAAE
jgi:hypothetical protein